MCVATIHLVGGGVLHLDLDGASPLEVAERLRRERALIGRAVTEADGEPLSGEVLIPVGRLQLVRWE